jgi:hypothetical protein
MEREILRIRGDERALADRIRALDLRVRRGLPGGSGVIVDVVLKIDAVKTRLEDERLRHRNAVAVGPAERDAKLGFAIQLVFGLSTAEWREMSRTR